MSTNPFSRTLFGMAAALFVLCPAAADNTDSSAKAKSELSPRQQQHIRSAFAKLSSPGERKMAMKWSDAKKVAETMCRPAALNYFQKQYTGADRVFLGTGESGSLKLEGNRQLTGTGQVREGNNWHYFTFDCQLNPATGYAVSFTAHITKTESYIRQSL
ncbi:hypothetical protein [Oxalobacter paraformigenes]|uniref:DUF930 domain-containing protein n=1 Tax=Oxalobacter paraformigenes TaxID=556268 RepID=C3X2L9_9BURK|nr:hypothetical protein [Oxalobacter paraformigenes]EEO27455.2 hypothetical protein OFAG_00608 [Oxalobacter paraformigenes]